MAQISIKYPKTIYTPESILMAAATMSNYGSLVLEDKESYFLAKISIDQNQISKDNYTHKFNEIINDFQLRTSLAERTAIIRQMIIAQAFAPCDNLLEIVESYIETNK